MAVSPTSFYGNLLIVTEALKRRYGLDTDAMLAEVGVDLKAAAREDYRVPQDAVDRVWKMAVQATGNPTIGLDVVDDMNPAVYRSLGVALLCLNSRDTVVVLTLLPFCRLRATLLPSTHLTSLLESCHLP